MIRTSFAVEAAFKYHCLGVLVRDVSFLHLSDTFLLVVLIWHHIVT